MAAAGERSRRKWLAPEVVQTSAMDCGPAALKCVLEGFGIPVSYGRLREACQTDVDGTSIDTIEEVANRLGIDAEQVMLPVDHLFLRESRTLPAIVVVRQADASPHFVVVWRRVGRWVQLMDPAVGRRWVPLRRFAADVFSHEMGVAAPEWRDWAAGEEFTAPLLQQLVAVGASHEDAKGLIDNALQDALWFGAAALEASVRFAQSMIDAGALDAGEETMRLVTALFERTHQSTGDIFQLIPSKYWSVMPDRADAEGVLQLRLRGAVLLRLRAREPSAAAEGEAAAAASERSPELALALTEKPANPLKTVWSLLKLDGLLGPWAMAGAVGIAAAVVLVEMLLFRGLFDVTWSLNLPVQRMVALLGLMSLIALLMLVEIPVVTESMRYGRHLEVRLRMALLAKLPHLGDRYLQSRPVSDMADRSHSLHMARQVPAFGLHLVQILFDLGFTLAGIAFIDTTSVPIAVLIAVIAVLVPALAQPLLNERDLRMRNHSGALHVFNLDALLGLVPIRTHGAERAIRRQHEGLLVEWARSARGLLAMALSVQAVQSLLCLGLVAVLLLSHFTRKGAASGADLLLVYWALKLPALGHSLAALAHQYPAQRNVLLRLLEPLSAPEEPRTASASPALAAPTGAASISLRAAKVVAGGHTILDGVHLDVAPGEHVAIVGASGSGKSTLLGLLLGWHRISEGELRVDGSPLDADTQERLRSHVAWVDPGVQLWNRSFLENLTYAAGPDHLERMGEVLDATKLRRVLQHLPEGLQSHLGEGGALLSGGEGQRVRLARALMQSGVRLALLDEPFRGLDRSQRGTLLSQARQWWKDATLLCVTHDVAETLSFGRVIVVDGGRIVEDGPPLQLAAAPSRYREMLDAERDVRGGLWQDAGWRRLRVDNGRVVEAGERATQAQR